MQSLLETIMDRPVFSVGLGAFLSGVALLYVLMQRTRRHRIEQSGKTEL